MLFLSVERVLNQRAAGMAEATGRRGVFASEMTGRSARQRRGPRKSRETLVLKPRAVQALVYQRAKPRGRPTRPSGRVNQPKAAREICGVEP